MIALALCGARLGAQEEIADGVTVGVERGVELFWAVQTGEGDDWPALANRFMDGPEGAGRLQAANRGAPAPGSLVKIPWTLLRDDERRLTALTLFPLDGEAEGDWLHVVGQAEKLPRESLAGIALWFTGDPAKYDAILAANPGAANGLAPGQQLRIPKALLLPAFLPAGEFEAWQKADAARRAAAPKLSPAPPPVLSPAPASPPASAAAPAPASVAASTPAPPPRSAPLPLPPPLGLPPPSAPRPAPPTAPARETPESPLEYGRDAQGEFGVYRLKAGEALYSSVVIRFMGLVDAPEVNRRALEVARDNGIADVTHIAAGAPLKLRAAWLLPQYAPPGSAARLKYDARQRELAQADAEEAAEEPELPLAASAPKSDKLKGLTVILDAGHGGPDPGAMYNGAWESDFVYDIYARVKNRLEAETAAVVVPIVRDPAALWAPRGAISARTQKIEILSQPPYTPGKGETREAVNQRVKAVNARARGLDGGAVVFTSFHADALHPSARGTMVYIPDAELAGKRGGARARGAGDKVLSGGAALSHGERIKAEAASGRLAGALIRTLRGRRLDVHAFDPVRGFVVRGGRPWVPAVIRDTDLTYKLLVEVCNLANDDDAENLRDPAYRQKIADAYVDTLLAMFGGGRAPAAAKPASKPVVRPRPVPARRKPRRRGK